MQVEEIRSMLEEGIAGAEVTLDGDGTHFQTLIVSEAFAGKSMVQRHQMVYQVLGDKMGGEIHALSIRALTPGEWEKQRDLGIAG